MIKEISLTRWDKKRRLLDRLLNVEQRQLGLWRYLAIDIEGEAQVPELADNHELGQARPQQNPRVHADEPDLQARPWKQQT